VMQPAGARDAAAGAGRRSASGKFGKFCALEGA
jgi:hypothetical protein